MKVLFVTPFYEPAWVYGGMARASRDWARSLSSVGVEVSVLTTAANGGYELDMPLGIPVDRDGVQVTYYPRWRKSGNRFVSPGLWQACRAITAEFDAVHSVGLWTFPALVSSWVAQDKRTPYLVSLHGMLMPWAYGHNSLWKRMAMAWGEGPRLRRARRLVCTSEMELQYLDRLRLGECARVVPNVVDVGGQKPQPNRFRERFQLEGAFVILFAGRLVENKGLHLTLPAFSNIALHFPEVHLVVAGPAEDNSAERARRYVHLQGLQHRVRFTGLLTGADYWDAVAAADLFVLNSYSENFGLAPAEALAFGIPVLVSDHVGIAHLVSEYHAGLVAPLHVNAISEAMAHAIVRRDSLPEMGQNGIRLVRERFSLAAVGKSFAGLIKEILPA